MSSVRLLGNSGMCDSSFALDFGRIRLCGREKELKQLRQAFDRIVSRRDGTRRSVAPAQAVLIQGASGTGKSFLVEEFHREYILPYHRNSVYFCHGKYSDEDGQQQEHFRVLGEGIDMLWRKFGRDRAIQIAIYKHTTSHTSFFTSNLTEQMMSDSSIDWKILVKQEVNRSDLKVLSTISSAIQEYYSSSFAFHGSDDRSNNDNDSVSATSTIGDININAL